jgi:hypothetical protein
MKSRQLILCLCWSHNCCIDQQLEKLALSLQVNLENDVDEDLFPTPSMADQFESLSHGAFPLEPSPSGMNEHLPEQILHGGEHYKDAPCDVR